MRLILYLLALWFSNTLSAQTNFPYDIELVPVTVDGMPGLHSYAFAQHDGKWLIIGGRTDGLHARQPFNAFPQAQNNTTIYVIDVNANQFWTASVTTLPSGIAEQLQSTNMNFFQDGDSVYIIGGYAYSVNAADHITFPNLTSVLVPDLINAVISGSSITPYFKQITNDAFAVCGGQLGKIENTFFLVGGHRFDGRYNPNNGASFTQTYTNQIRKFEINNSGTQLEYSNYETITDAVHLHRRDYNLLPQIFPDGSEGYLISSGVFQIAVDLPFLYPVEIRASGHTPVTSFDQYLSNYHSAKASLYDANQNNMHMLFFGGMSQYYYEGGNLIQDDQVPFVKTISLVSRNTDGVLKEYQLPAEMPELKGASAEFIPNISLPHYESEIIKLSEIDSDTILIGHIFGGIVSPSQHPFTNNQTSSTSADATIYAVRLIYNPFAEASPIDGSNPYSFEVFPNPAKTSVNIRFQIPELVDVDYLISTLDGKIIDQGIVENHSIGNNVITIPLDRKLKNQMVLITLIFDHKFYVTKQVFVEY